MRPSRKRMNLALTERRSESYITITKNDLVLNMRLVRHNSQRGSVSRRKMKISPRTALLRWVKPAPLASSEWFPLMAKRCLLVESSAHFMLI